MAKKRKFRISAGLVFGWLGLLVAIGFFYLRADESGDQMVELFLRNQIQVKESALAVRSQSQLLKVAMKEKIVADSTQVNLGLKDTIETILEPGTETLLGKIKMHLVKLDSMAGRQKGDPVYQRPGEKGPNILYWERHLPELKTNLGEYSEMIRSFTQKEGGEAPDFSNWEDLPVDGPYIANIVLLQGLKLEVLQAERNLLDLYNQRLGVAAYQTNQVIAWSMPNTRSGLVGIPYEVQIGFMTTSDVIQPTFSSPNGTVRPNEGLPTATLTIVPDEKAIPFGKTEGIQNYSAYVEIPQVGGGTADLSIQEEFIVRKPIATIQPRKGQFFYRYCGNDVQIKVPDLPEMANLSITASQAQVLPSQKTANLFRIIPTGNETDVRISSIYNGKKSLISSIPIQVISPPKPEIQLLVNGEVHEGEVPVSQNSEIAIGLLPNEEFQLSFGEDAHYGIGSVEVRVQGSGPQQILKVIEGSLDAVNDPVLISLDDEKYLKDRKGEVVPILLKIDGIFQKNYAGKRIPDTEFTTQERTRILFVR